jgi:hypothetical protein
VSTTLEHKNFIESNILNVKKIFLNKLDLNELKNLINEYEYMIFICDNTNYVITELSNHISLSTELLNLNNNIDQILFYNLAYENINESLIDNKNYITSNLTILQKNNIKCNNNINYKNYVEKNFNRLFVPSVIKVSLLMNYTNDLKNDEHSELIFFKYNNINRHILCKDINFKIIDSKYKISNINDDLTIVTGFIKLNEPKIHKNSKQVYEYLTECEKTLKININMVIYISKELYNDVYNIRKKYDLLEKTKIIEVNIEKDLYFYEHLKQIENNVSKNIQAYSSAKKILSVVSRYNYLENAITNNYFNSKYFSWLDFSAGHIVKIPDSLIFNDIFNDKILIAWIGRYNNGIFKFNYKVFAGGFFMGKKESMLKLIKLHNEQFKLLMDYGYTINDDKLLFFIYEKNPYLFKTYFSDYSLIITKIL